MRETAAEKIFKEMEVRNMKIIEMMERQHVLIGMVHCLPLPGTINYGGSMEAVTEKAVNDALVLEETGFDAVLVEPTLDRPSGMNRGKLQLAAMSVVCGAVKRAVKIPIGVSFFTHDCSDMFSIAKAAGADFVRVTTFVDTVIFPAGISYPHAVKVWEVRRDGDMKDIAVLADIQVKHGKMMYPEIALEESARFAQMQGADAVIVTGTRTGEEAPMETIQRAKRAVTIPVVVGSGVSAENIGVQMESARGFIVGSSIKENGKLEAPVDRALARQLCAARDKAEEHC